MTQTTRKNFPFIPEVGLFLMRGGHILLSKRQNTGYADGQYHLIAGHKEKGEEIRSAMAREAKEEAGLSIKPEDLKLAMVMHRKVEKNEERIAFFFTAEANLDEPVNQEPHKCAELAWFPLDSLPENTVPYVRHAIERARAGERYGTFGWP